VGGSVGVDGGAAFLLNHSVAYGAAAVCSWAEFWGESWLLPAGWVAGKSWQPAVLAGAGLMVAGELCRKCAMFTARHNFSHLIATERRSNHVLVTHGIYAISRHPSYMGWFWWSVGTQLLLCNPICTLGYTAATFAFFRERIVDEERILLNFFGPAYDDYQRRVGTGVPFISGCRATPAERECWAQKCFN
jgi:protein-S-isoprenylcysteine O-methyltransferase